MKSLLTFTLLGALAGMLPASAATMYADWEGVSGGQVDMTLNNGASWQRAGGGIFSFKRTAGGDFTDGPAVGELFNAICIEPTEYIHDGPKAWTIGTLPDGNSTFQQQGKGFSPTQVGLLLELLGLVMPDFGAPPAGNDVKMALQLAVWEIVQESGSTLDVLNGATRFRNASGGASVFSTANGYLATILSTTVAPADGIVTMFKVGDQDYAFQAGSTPPEEVPEPSHLLGLGLLALVAYRKFIG